MVGLFAYNPPLILDAVREAGKIGKIKIVSFDEDERSLEGIVDGSIYGTTVQNPYEYGHKSIEILAALARSDQSVIPEGGFIDIPARNIRKDNVDEFWSELKRLTATNAPADSTKTPASNEPPDTVSEPETAEDEASNKAEATTDGAAKEQAE